MRNYASLTRVLFKDVGATIEMKFGGQERKWLSMLLWVLIGLGFLPLMYIFYVMFLGFFEVFAPTGQLSYITGLMLNITGIVIFILSAFAAPAILYFSKEVEYLLPLPLTPSQIIGAKFTVSLLTEYLVALFVLVPMYAAYIQYLPPFSLTINMILVFLTLPVTPLVYSTVMVMAMMRLPLFSRNKDMYHIIIGVCSVFIGLFIGMYSQRLNTVSAEQMLTLVEGNSMAFSALRTIFPAFIFAGHAIANGDWAAQGLNYVITLATLSVFFLLAEMLYFKGVIGLSESSSPAKRMSLAEIGRGAKNSPVFLSCLQKEFWMLFRSPTALINCVMMVFLLPIMLIVPFFMNNNDNGLEMAKLVSSLNFNDPLTAAYIMTGAAATGYLISSMNLVTATSISREGQQYIFMKYIPVSYRLQLNAKIASGVAVGLMGATALLILLKIFLKAPASIFMAALMLMLPGIVFLSCLGLLIDMLKPRLVWDTEQRAIKQNMNVMILMLAGMAMTVVVAIIGIVFLKTPIIAFFVLFLVNTALAVAGYFFVTNLSVDLMTRLNA